MAPCTLAKGLCKFNVVNYLIGGLESAVICENSFALHIPVTIV